MKSRSKGASGNQLIYGTRAVMEAVQAGKEFERLFVQKNIKSDSLREVVGLLKQYGIPFQKVPIEKLNRITRKNHQGIIAYFSSIAYASLDSVISSAYESGKSPFIIILDRITDVRNFGAICRTAECAGVHGIVIPTKGGAQINPDAIKTSAGALNYIPVCRETNLLHTLRFLKDNGLSILACTEKTNKSIYEQDLQIPIAAILGSEENGIMPELLKMSDVLCRIPMQGKIASLNVSVAAGVLIYEVLRQRSL